MEVSGGSADILYKECWWKLPLVWEREESRNGPVYTVPEPVMLKLAWPERRVVFNPIRDANPFFHIAEVVWMFAGSDDVRFIEQFNKRYREYADRDSDRVHGAYGKRWIDNQWDTQSVDQVQKAIDILKTDPKSRQVVIQMWNAYADLGTHHADRPCNTQLMLRICRGQLDMLVVNRSNDLVWGALGANIVHFTYLQEVIARSLRIPMGDYRVVTNNLHFYPEMPRAEEHRQSKYWDPRPYPNTYPVLQDGEAWKMLHYDCKDYVERGFRENHDYTKWMRWVAIPMMEGYLDKTSRGEWVDSVRANDWRAAAFAWMDRR